MVAQAQVAPVAGQAPAPAARTDAAELKHLITDLSALRADMAAAAARARRTLERVDPEHRESAWNLLCYLALRRHDIRPLQQRLSMLGLSSLGRAEPHVMATLDAVLDVLHALARQARAAPADGAVDIPRGRELLARHTEALFGASDRKRDTRIMVTMPSEAASDEALVRTLLKQGMDCMRINCAHDDAGAWQRMIDNLRRAERALERKCRVVMDLAGPKLRTGPIEPGPQVLRVQPRRDAFGRVVKAARVRLGATPPAAAATALAVPAAWLGQLRVRDAITFLDARGSHRTWTVVEVDKDGCWAEARKTAYVVPGTVLRRSSDTATEALEAPVGPLPAVEGVLVLKPGDTLTLTRDARPGRPAAIDGQGKVVTPATLGCTLPEALAEVKPGETVWFDDGRIGGTIEKVERDAVHVAITTTRAARERLRGYRSINLPDSRLQLAALTARDLDDLAFVAKHADVVELSFASNAKDVEALHERLRALGGRLPAVVLKIETRRGFDNLPAMLLAAMQMPSCGVMIARGDLAVECGFERLAEVQEEILWVCEAAHVPVIWATQVLEGLSKQGVPSRAEITDAAMGHRAECVMLNKGPHVVAAVRLLDGILRRMQGHQAKKRSMLRELRLAHEPVGFASLNPPYEAAAPKP